MGQDLIGQLSVAITDKTREKVAKSDTKDSAAYVLYLRGVKHARKITEPDIRTAIDLFSQAIEKDPSYARAYAAKLTEEGARVLKTHDPMARRVDERILSSLPAQQRDRFVQDLNAIVQTLNKLREKENAGK